MNDIKDNTKAVAYLDTLGFSQAVREDIGKAALLLTEFNSIVCSKIREKNMNPSSCYPSGLKDLAKRSSFEDIEYFMPFSDSIFAASTNPDQFLMQMGRFVYESFMVEAYQYAHPVDKTNPTLVKEVVVKVDKMGHSSTDYQNSEHQPILFRGGFAFGEVHYLNPTAIVNGNKINAKTLAGEAVVRAVGLESGLKGPRLTFRKEYYEQLSDITKRYCRIVPEVNDRYEILWPALGYITENHEKHQYKQEMCHFYSIFNPACNLWKFYKDNETLNPHYTAFVEIIIASAIQVYDLFFNDMQYAVSVIESALKGKGMYDEFECVMK